MDISFPTHSFVKKVSFEFATPDALRRLSVKHITSPMIFDSLNNPVPGGLYDPALGPIDKNARCPTCSLTAFQCPGHFGHIELTVPVYAPMVFGSMFQLLRQSCLYCHRLRAGRLRVALVTAKLRLLQAGLLMESIGLDGWLDGQSTADLAGQGDVEAAEEGGIGPEHGTRLDESAIIDRLNRHIKALIQKRRAEGGVIERKSAALQAQRQAVIDDFLKKSVSSNQCTHCKHQVHGLHRHANTKIFLLPSKKHHHSLLNGSDVAADESGMKYLTPIHVFEHLRKVWETEHVVLELLYCGGASPSSASKGRPDFNLFFTKVIAVPPCRFRPPSVFGDSQFDHPQNTYLTEILKLNQRIVDLRLEPKDAAGSYNPDDTDASQSSDPKFALLMQTWISLQEQVNYLFDSSRNQSPSGKIAPAGIKQILEKKEGLFRKHMMGKRVNYAARSVISPDAMIETSEIGVPLVFAKRLTYPEPVTQFNVEALKQAVINGPDTYPGASHVQMEDGSLSSLEVLSIDARRSLANALMSPPARPEGSGNNKKVYRHIRNGDSVIMNRQPTLHKPSMMSHRVRVLSGEKTLRMHYANCNTYNADFDGDEMNLHFPQNQLARAEAQMIANTNRQYLGCTDGSPLRGLIQDHISTGVVLSVKDSLFDRDIFQQLLFGALPEDCGTILFPTPAIIHPQRLWTGKQLISAVLMNLTAGLPQLNLHSNSRTPGKLLRGHAEETQVVVFGGQIMTGIMDKSQFGASAYGITHAVYELYGPDCAGRLLTAMGRLFTRYDQHYGFTCRMDDILLTQAANQRRRKLIEDSQPVGRQVAIEFCGLSSSDERGALRAALEKASRSDEQLKALDGAMKGKMNECTSKIIEACLPDGQLVPFPKNNMALMTQTGAKGSMVNFSQITGLLGQQELEGRRVPVMVSGKTLPSFRAWDTRPRAGGYITQRFMTGIRPQEFFFHCMAGREGLIDTAVKTSRSGYLQRCLIKHLEALRVHYDHTVRDDDGSVVQFRYGEDGLDVTKQKYLGKLAFAADNFAAIIASNPPETLDRVDTEEARKASKRALRQPDKYDPVLSLYPPSAHLGAVGERFAHQLEQFLDKDPGPVDVKQFRAIMWLKYMRSLADPGEAVGLLAAQSIGEPSTQMTLNTFHFAGFGAKNVTLGIPRLREIIMTATSKIKTPMMTVALRGEAGASQAGQLAALLSKVTARQLVRLVEVSERLDSSKRTLWRSVVGSDRARVYSVAVHLCSELPAGLTRLDVRSAFENAFVLKLMTAIDRALKRTSKAAVAKADELVQSIAEARSRAVKLGAAEADDGDGDGDGDREGGSKETKKKKDFTNDEDDQVDEAEMDASDAKAAARKKQAATYDDDYEEDGDEYDNDGHYYGREGRADTEEGDAGTSSGNRKQSPDSDEEGPADDDGRDSQAGTVKEEPYELKFTRIADYKNIRDFNITDTAVVFSLCYPASSPKLLMLDLVERVINETVVRQVPQVSRAFANPPSSATDNTTTISTEGVNLRGVWDWACSSPHLAGLLDLDTVTSNDICAVLSTYGVEAARATIVSEIAGVFGVYGISVDPRHLSLIADYMTLDGGYRPFNRMGIAHSVSPLLKMSFETTVGFLKQAVLVGDHDELETPAARIVMGQPVKLGTGSFQVLHKLVV